MYIAIFNPLKHIRHCSQQIEDFFENYLDLFCFFKFYYWYCQQFEKIFLYSHQTCTMQSKSVLFTHSFSFFELFLY